MPEDNRLKEQAQARPAFDAQAPLVAAAPDATAVDSAESAARLHSIGDRRSALRLFSWTVLASFAVSGVLEYLGWQIIFRMVPSLPPDIPAGDFVLSALKTTSAALGIGAGVGVVGLLLPSLRRRPWRSLAAGVAVGSASFLGFLAWLTSLAP